MLIRLEIKKAFIKRYYLFVFVSVVLLEGLFFCLQSKDVFLTSNDQKTYEKYVDTFCGDLTNHKQQIILFCFQFIDNADELINKAKALYQANKLSLNEYRTINEISDLNVTGRIGASMFKEDFAYALAKPERQIINIRAWTFVFGQEKIDFLLLLAIIVFVITVFVSERETEITQIKHTTIIGRISVDRVELLIGLVLAGLLSISISSLRFFIGMLKFEMSDYCFSIGSLPLFEHTSLNISLFQGYIISTTIKTLGYMSFTALCFIFGCLFNNSVMVALSSLLTVILPKNIIQSSFYGCFFSPIYLISDNCFLKDWVTTCLPLSVIIQITTKIISLSISIAISITVLLAAFIIIKNRGHKKCVKEKLLY